MVSGESETSQQRDVAIQAAEKAIFRAADNPARWSAVAAIVVSVAAAFGVRIPTTGQSQDVRLFVIRDGVVKSVELDEPQSDITVNPGATLLFWRGDSPVLSINVEAEPSVVVDETQENQPPETSSTKRR